MTKAESRAAAQDGWKVRTETGTIGKVVRSINEEIVIVAWDGYPAWDKGHPVHIGNIERAD
jgi:hypothetical protein